MHNTNVNKPRLFLDLDGVFVDLDKKIKELYHKRYDDHGPYEVWSKLTHEQPNFFYNLDPMPDYILLLDAVHKMEDEYYISFLTSMPRPTGNLITAYNDKIKWVRKYLHDEWLVHTVPGWENKKKYVTSHNDILLDDAPRNIREWNEAGGVGILHKNVEGSIILLNEAKQRMLNGSRISS